MGILLEKAQKLTKMGKIKQISKFISRRTHCSCNQDEDVIYILNLS